MKKSTFIILILLNFFAIGCTDFDDNLIKPEATDLIQKDSKLYNMIEKNVLQEENTCINFIYPVITNEYDSNLNIVQIHYLYNDGDFINLLENLNNTNYIGISYPISTTLTDGTIFSINNNDELKENLIECYEEIILDECYEFCIPNEANFKCFWKVMYNENTTNPFYLSSFESNGDGTFNFYHNDDIYNANWVFLFLNDELHLNITIQGQNIASQNWNFDWVVEDITSDSMTLNNNSSSYKLYKTCTEQISYQIGSETPSGGIVIYDKGLYSNGWRYIESTKNYINTINNQWGCNNFEIANCLNIEIGKGLINSKSIIDYHYSANYYFNPTNCSPSSNGTVSSQKTCIFEQNGYKDWFLPSSHECSLIYENINLMNTNLVLDNFWSSTQSNISNANYFNNSNNTLEETNKGNNSIKTIAIRYF